MSCYEILLYLKKSYVVEMGVQVSYNEIFTLLYLYSSFIFCISISVSYVNIHYSTYIIQLKNSRFISDVDGKYAAWC